MPSRKGSRKTSRRRGSRKGRKPMKRSLRFMPKLVIRERSETIEDTLNATMGRTSFRIPIDVANIIQGYEGGEYLYFAYDPKLNSLVYSSNTPLKGGDKVIINYKPTDNIESYIWFGKVTMTVKLIDETYFTKDLFLAAIFTSRVDDDEEEIERYVFYKHYPIYTDTMKEKYGDNNIKKGTRGNIKARTDKVFQYPISIEEDKIIFEEDKMKIIFEKLL